MNQQQVLARPSGQTTNQVPTTASTVAVVGLGYVGLPLALLAEERGFSVRGFDIDTARIANLQKHKAPFLSHDEAAQLEKSQITFSTDEKILRGANIIVVCVPTPVDDDHRPELAPLMSASEAVGRQLRRGVLVVIESTVNPGACENLALKALQRESRLRAEEDFYFAHCPERINPGDATWTVQNIPRVVGASGPKSLRRAVDFYRSVTTADIVSMASIKEAEAVKMVENTFRDVNIAFINEIAMSFAKAGIDVANVIRGASTKPFGFLPHYPGCGVGGHCIPVDPYYLIRYGRENGFEHRFLVAAREVNNGMPRYTVDLLEKALAEREVPLAGATVALLGLGYKRDVPDLRESPALVIRTELIARGARVRAFDPFAPKESNVTSVAEALRGADATLVATDHTVFRELSPDDFIAQGVQTVVDGRNCLPKERFVAAGLQYRGIGR